MTQSDQKKLIKRCISGKREAYKELYDLYSEEMFKVCRIYAPDRDSANDFLQEGFLKVFQNLHKYSDGNLRAWIRKIISNSCIDQLRKDHWSAITTSFSENLMIDADTGIENNFEKSINSDSFFDILGQLPLGYRTILNLYFLEDYTHQEISVKLNISIGTSKSQLSKGKNYLKEILLRSLSHEEIELYVGRMVHKVV